MTPYKTLLAILQSELDTPRVLDFAVPFARRYESHLIGLHAEALPIAMITPMGGPAVDFSMEFENESKRRHERLRNLFEERARTEDIPAEWRGYDNISGDSAVSGIESARSADMVIAQQNDPDADARAVADIETLLFGTGRPVLLLPYSYTAPSEGFQKVVVAWNGSKEAARAAFDALPLLKEAKHVEILCVDPQDTLQQDASLAGAAIARSLARHGIHVSTRTETSDDASHAEVIANRLADSDSDLLVMGAYGRSRMSEFIFGGVTRGTLQAMTTPTLMSR